MISCDVIYYVINHPIKDQKPSTTQRLSNDSLEMGPLHSVMEQVPRNIQIIAGPSRIYHHNCL